MRHRMHSPGPFSPGSDVTIAGEEFHHAVRVVRVREGEEVELFDGKGLLAAGNVLAIGPSSVTVRVAHALAGRESPLVIHLAMAIINLEKFELVLQKATELGVRSIIPMLTERVEIRPERYRGKTERWEKIIYEAVKQSGRALLPVLEAPAPFESVIARDGVKIVFDADLPPGQAPASLDAVTMLVGPEGGFSEDEIRRSLDHGCLIQRLGPRRLRAETAAIAATAVLAARYGDI
jgi:16S rRNA (uracil1498-N3)-methyltransferase